MGDLLISYARVSTGEQDLTAQREALAGLGVAPERIYVDHGLTGATRARPGLREALAACHDGDTLVVTKLDCLARSLPDARDIADELTARQVKLSLGGSVHDPTDPVGRLLFNVLATIAEFERHAARGMSSIMPRVRLCRVACRSRLLAREKQLGVVMELTEIVASGGRRPKPRRSHLGADYRVAGGGLGHRRARQHPG